MDKRVPLVALAAITVVVLLIFLFPKGTGGDCDSLKASILSKIDAQKACVADSQCTSLSYGCPFGCGYYNKNSDMSEIDTLVQEYNSKCEACNYRCYTPKSGVACINGKCALAVCGDGICSTGENCSADCGGTNKSHVFSVKEYNQAVKDGLASGIYYVKGYVVALFNLHCPPCPPGAMCVPCIYPYLVLSDNKVVKLGYQQGDNLTDEELYLEPQDVNATDGLELLGKYSMTVKKGDAGTSLVSYQVSS